jgi:hypothetical protein
MTTDELERDLRTLTAPRAEDEDLRLAIRATLSDNLETQPTGRRHTRFLLGSAAAVAATVAAAIVVLIGAGGPSPADAAVLAHVTQAMTPPANIIVHVKETGTQADGTPVSAEWWQSTNAPYAMRLIKGSADYMGEGAADGTISSEYDARTNTISQHPDSKAPRLVDPVESARAALAAGTADVAGTVTIDGRSLYKIELRNGTTGYFDKTDYRPVYIDNPQHDGTVVRTRVITYEELPLTPENEKLLSLTAQHPDAAVTTSPAATK